jgi:hypothetical protein
MRELLKESCIDLILDPDLSPLVPYVAAINRYPDIIYHYGDRYSSALIKAIVNRNPQISKIAVLCSVGQTKSLPTYLQFSDCSLLSTLRTPDSLTQKNFFKADKVHHMVEKQTILDHLFLSRDEEASNFLEFIEDLQSGESSRQAQASYNMEPLFKTLDYLVKYELQGSPNGVQRDYDYFKHIYLMLFNNDVNQIKKQGYAEGRKRLRDEFKRRIRDDPNLIRKVQPV